ncbi:MAG: endonuclease MutS2 [Anaerolineae bacterium]|nr:endonuclease MutS2 [Anaerolineae bacterium]
MSMERSYWEKLELPAVLARLSEHASFSAGRDLALALTPSTDVGQVRRRQRETDEARRLLSVKPDLTLGGAHDLLPLVANALRGARLLPTDLLDVHDTLRRAEVLRRSLVKLEVDYPLIVSLVHRLETCPDIVAEIERCISERGDVLDRASPELGRIRSELSVAHDRLMDKLNRILSSPEHASYLQETYITQRDGRFVIPVRSDAKGHIPGLVHDQSSSGATSFIEPLATVELNNRYRELQLAEQREVERILLRLSGLVAEAAEPIQRTVETLAQLDLILARAKYADATRATMPEMLAFATDRPALERRHPGSVIDLRQARHPLLDSRSVVPIDVHLGDDYFVIVITGPNTGGKTVSLKTVGLLSLMAQCGLHLPTGEGSRLTVFEHICADIGDEQSIEQSLSTFSSHMGHIIRILDTVDDRALVLLDELGAGTDPVEGAALAQSLLTHLVQRRVTTIATTHYAELKVYAHDTPGVINASVEFDLETLSPTYHLRIGLPGHSNAFSIAERLGLPAPIVRRAQSLVSSTHLDAERFLSQIKEAQAQTAEAQAQAEDARAETRRTAEELRARLSSIEREREAVLREARAQAAEELETVRRELRALQRRMALMSASPADLGDVEARLDALEARAAPVAPVLAPPPVPTEGAVEAIEVGDTVWVADLNATGEVLDIDGAAVEVQVGSFRVRTRMASLELRHKAPQQVAPATQPEIAVPTAPDVSLELHLRGLRVDEALPRLEKYLDEAYRAQAPFVRIVHGKGTGALRKAVRDFLQHYPLVASYRDGETGEGDTGVTIARFAYG